MKPSTVGFQLVELVIALALFSLIVVVSIPSLVEISARMRVRMAAQEVANTLVSARSHAVRYSARVGVKFRTLEDGRVTYTLYRDGDGDGVRNADIASGRDPAVGPPRQLQGFGSGVRFGFPQGVAPRDPGNPSRRLDRLDDPLRFNVSDLASFDPVGGSTPGTAYLTDGQRQLAAVRVYGRTGKLRILIYDVETETWGR